LVKIASSGALERDGYTTGEVVATADELNKTGYSTYGLFSGWNSIGPYQGKTRAAVAQPKKQVV
jgi:hypothetical protein